MNRTKMNEDTKRIITPSKHEVRQYGASLREAGWKIEAVRVQEKPFVSDTSEERGQEEP